MLQLEEHEYFLCNKAVYNILTLYKIVTYNKNLQHKFIARLISPW